MALCVINHHSIKAEPRQQIEVCSVFICLAYYYRPVIIGVSKYVTQSSMFMEMVIVYIVHNVYNIDIHHCLE